MAESDGLENRCVARHRGFESHSLRQVRDGLRFGPAGSDWRPSLMHPSQACQRASFLPRQERCASDNRASGNDAFGLDEPLSRGSNGRSAGPSGVPAAKHQTPWRGWSRRRKTVGEPTDRWIDRSPAERATPTEAMPPEVGPPDAKDISRPITTVETVDPGMTSMLFVAATTGCGRGDPCRVPFGYPAHLRSANNRGQFRPFHPSRTSRMPRNRWDGLRIGHHIHPGRWCCLGFTRTPCETTGPTRKPLCGEAPWVRIPLPSPL